MMREYYTVGILVILLCATIAPVSASFAAYSIGPAYGSTGNPAPDLAPASIWNLPLREMALAAALIFCPVFVIPIELFFAVKLFAVLAFRRIARSNILDNATRNRIYEEVLGNPGISFPALSRQASLSRSALTYHLTLLIAQHKIVSLKTNGTTCYFENNGRYDGLEQKIRHYLSCEVERKILTRLLAAPGSTRADLEELLAVSGPTVTWHMKRLIDDGILAGIQDGRYCRYSLSGESAACVARCLERGREIPVGYRGTQPHIPGASAAGS
ncbi:MAG: winged helix-turn-helix transcriptional regulator [Methanoregula sp.]|jgi:predicted transcriptional regulator